MKPQRLKLWLRAGTWAAGGRQSYLPAAPGEVATGFEGFAFASALPKLSTAGGYSPEKIRQIVTNCEASLSCNFFLKMALEIILDQYPFKDRNDGESGDRGGVFSAGCTGYTGFVGY
ncbi:hypothetical protein [Microcoleus sp. FACHB-68]|uniref:hypothetical protein n=1 Tax=Microcoleus sp. FACHB-68 TaxID=2692826 RepID=UPI001685D786|nr:hypothetical protein [Microcoleus sp. FACHB-68]MBD1939124.1 hypothetical protein [Microcoleus sp. FACHB-68]